MKIQASPTMLPELDTGEMETVDCASGPVEIKEPRRFRARISFELYCSWIFGRTSNEDLELCGVGFE